MEIWEKLVCPRCKTEDKWQLGPRGGTAINIRCICGYELSVTKLRDGRWWVEDITNKPQNMHDDVYWGPKESDFAKALKQLITNADTLAQDAKEVLKSLDELRSKKEKPDDKEG